MGVKKTNGTVKEMIGRNTLQLTRKRNGFE